MWNNTRRYGILHTLNLGCSFITLREPCNNQRPRGDIAWLHATYHSYHDFRVKRLDNLTFRVWLFNGLTLKTMVYILLKHQLIVISLNSFMLRKLNMILVRIHTSYVHNKHMFENLCISRILPLSTILIFDLGIVGTLRHFFFSFN